MALTLASVLLAGAPSFADSARESTRYFAWAALKAHPVRPTDEITPEEARSREAAGQAYYIATYDDLGRIVSLEKRLRGIAFFRLTYAYPNGEPVRTDLVLPPVK